MPEKQVQCHGRIMGHPLSWFIQEPLLLTFVGQYISVPVFCSSCQRHHGELLDAPAYRKHFPPGTFGEYGPGRIRDISFACGMPIAECRTGYVNVKVLLQAFSETTHSNAFTVFMQSHLCAQIRDALWPYYLCPSTVLSNTDKLSIYMYDHLVNPGASYLDYFGDKRAVRWMHPYVMVAYCSLLRAVQPICRDVQTLEALLGGTLWKDYEHFRLDMGIQDYGLHRLSLVSNMGRCFEKDTAPRVPSKTSVYLIQKGRTRVYKIGMSNNPQQRLKALQASNPDTLRLVYTWPVPKAYDVEHFLHEMFASVRIQGEWFTLSHEQEAELLVYMAQYEEKGSLE